MAALLIAWGVFSIAVIAHAILGTRPPLPSRGEEEIPPGNQTAAEERARMMEAIALSVF
jgi:hypothetical protein